MYSRYKGNDHIQARVAGTGSRASLICNGSIVEHTKGFKLTGVLCFLATVMCRIVSIWVKIDDFGIWYL